ncbi:MAG TPA: hypothetical protein VLV15_03960, partial [Dongiaceae bacterium]|nr:hypothetical protein [Dongiaceae bacterium]
MAGPRTIRITTPRAERAGGAHRVSADVDGVTVWLESPDAPLDPAPEAFASAFLLPALTARARLVSDQPLDPVWLDGSRRLATIFRSWWRTPRIVPAAPSPGDTAEDASIAQGPPSPPAQGLFFSGGVDSFHGLLCCDRRFECLVFVTGFDVPLGDHTRLSAALASVREVAAAAGSRLVTVRTNLRDHPLVQAAAWERANGGALAAVAHVLAGVVGGMAIGSSVAVGWKGGWGSHWETDPLYGSRRMRIGQLGTDLHRLDKVRRIAALELPRRHLRVCWENRTPTGNCSRCGKCVVTRLMLAESGVLDQYPVFEGTATLAAATDALVSDTHRESLTDIVRTG